MLSRSRYFKSIGIVVCAVVLFGTPAAGYTGEFLFAVWVAVWLGVLIEPIITKLRG